MQIMTEKGLVVRDESKWSHVYEAAVPAQQTQRQLVRDLLDRAFRGSAQQLVVQALSAKRATRQELAEIRRMIDELEREA
jgi:predicted transcriptional regulator